jgi:hypothetical protein
MKVLQIFTIQEAYTVHYSRAHFQNQRNKNVALVQELYIYDKNWIFPSTAAGEISFIRNLLISHVNEQNITIVESAILYSSSTVLSGRPWEILFLFSQA